MRNHRFAYFFILNIIFIFNTNISVYAQTTSPAATMRFMTIADIHFNPFAYCERIRVPPECPLIKKLRQAPASQWPTILAKYDPLPAENYRDTNYALLKPMLQHFQQVAITKKAQYVLVLGDFLAHGYRDNYRIYSLDQSLTGYESFVKKTMEFLTNELNHAFPSIDVYPVVGNNDSYRRDYQLNPSGKFFHDTASIWSALIKNKNNKNRMQHEFPAGGYYAIDIPQQPNLRLLVLNTVFFSNRVQGERITFAANAQLNWLHQELEQAHARQQKVFIAMHIPAGVDVYASLQLRLFRIIELWEREYSSQFEAQLQLFAPDIIAIFAGHLHTDWFQVLTLDQINNIAVTGTPAVSPIFGNDPGFKIYKYSFTSQRLEDFDTYYYPIKNEKGYDNVRETN